MTDNDPSQKTPGARSGHHMLKDEERQKEDKPVDFMIMTFACVLLFMIFLVLITQTR